MKHVDDDTALNQPTERDSNTIYTNSTDNYYPPSGPPKQGWGQPYYPAEPPKKNNTVYVGILFGVIVSLIILMIVYFINANHKRELQQIEEENKQLMAEAKQKEYEQKVRLDSIQEAMRDAEVASAQQQQAAQQAAVSAQRASDTAGLSRYSVVVRSCGTRAQAESLQAELRNIGESATIHYYSQKNMWRVVVFTSNSRSEANDYLNYIRDYYPDAWMLSI